MAKTQSVEKREINVAMIINGVVLVVISPFVAPVLAIYQNSHCAKDSFGNCTLSSSLTAGIIDFFIPWVFCALGLIFIIVAVVKDRKK